MRKQYLEENRHTFDCLAARSPEEAKSMNTAQLREAFLIDQLFASDRVCAAYSMQDRMIALGVMPAKKAISLPIYKELTKADYFLERREMGIINVGGKGAVTVNKKEYVLNKKDALYIGQGNQDIEFASESENTPALFYCNSAPAHASHPTTQINQSSVEPLTLGDAATASYRKLYQCIIPSRVKSCQLVMGFTELLNGSVWNTTPPHTHKRRMESYFYFDLPKEQMLIHLMGEPTETRHLIVRNHQAVISPEWSIHCGAATSSYAFVWAMAGENQDFADMDKLTLEELF
ncbi:MAG: 5-dehydro-4-deoxy-D-glucuronate isomerase [Candidatus Nephrothrix sp. EaCA]|nr:MAG: 5-dehydro-4-deoxy-D-glucuronate isomerase [Candidatus Nephrothrix sp. EaCA]